MPTANKKAKRKTKKATLLWYKNVDWATASFLLGLPVFAAVAVPVYFYLEGGHWGLLPLFLVYYWLTTLSITAGYHRYLAHRAYEVKPWLKFFFLFFGAPTAFQGSALEWCSDHRRHHQEVDTDLDPYNIKRGFFYAHLGWMLEKDHPQRVQYFSPDLLADKMVRLQHRYYISIAIFNCFLVPMLIGWSFGTALGGLLIGGVLRLILAHHATFFINSLCHTLGRQPYQECNTAKDSLIMAFLTQGEGYHNFHHKFSGDYRNGIRWYHWDPTKWFILFLYITGLARNLKTTPSVLIFRARLKMEGERLLVKGVSQEKLELLKDKIFETQTKIKILKKEYYAFKKQWKHTQNARLRLMRMEYKKAKLEFQMALAEWQCLEKGGGYPWGVPQGLN